MKASESGVAENLARNIRHIKMERNWAQKEKPRLVGWVNELNVT